MALTTSDNYYAQMRQRELDAANRLAELGEKFMRLCQEAGEKPLTADPDWEEFNSIAPPQLSIDIIMGWHKNRKRNALLDLISECTAPLDDHQGFSVIHVRTNKLLAAILLKLHGIE